MAASEKVMLASFPDEVAAALSSVNVPINRRSYPGDTVLQHTFSDGRKLNVALPITFTPYASVKACSARCQFCSENLRTGSSPLLVSSMLRPDQDYFNHLDSSLRELEGIPLGISLSGLEATDDVDWLCRVLSTLRRREQNQGYDFPEKFLYSNGAGFAERVQRKRLISALGGFGIHRIEFSRHSNNQQENDAIMRFRKGELIASNDTFVEVMLDAAQEFDVRLVCIPQSGGIDTFEKLESYLEWADGMGVTEVIFREFSRLTSAYTENNTAQYINRHRIDLTDLMRSAGLLNGAQSHWCAKSSTLGYYFWNLTFGWKRKIKVTFEAADYAVMSRLHRSDIAYKLVLHANGNLTADWSPYKRVIPIPGAREEGLPLGGIDLMKESG